MSISKLQVLLLSTIVVSTAFADSDKLISSESASSAFHQQNPDTSCAQPQSESNYFARLAKTPSKLRSYIGLGAGIDMSNLTPTMASGSNSEAINSNSLKSSIAGDIYGGIGTNLSNFYIGTELSFGYNSLNKKFTTSSSALLNKEMTVKKPLTIGLDLIPGFLSPEQNFLFYGRMGLGGDWFKVNIANEANSKWNKIDLTWRLGAGMEYFISESTSMRLDYVFSTSNKITKSFTSSSNNASFYRLPSLYDHKVTVGLAFNF